MVDGCVDPIPFFPRRGREQGVGGDSSPFLPHGPGSYTHPAPKFPGPYPKMPLRAGKWKLFKPKSDFGLHEHLRVRARHGAGALAGLRRRPGVGGVPGNLPPAGSRARRGPPPAPAGHPPGACRLLRRPSSGYLPEPGNPPRPPSRTRTSAKPRPPCPCPPPPSVPSADLPPPPCFSRALSRSRPERAGEGWRACGPRKRRPPKHPRPKRRAPPLRPPPRSRGAWSSTGARARSPARA